jgi:sugar/nucleoside kinase (ribokinase family)
MPTIYTMGELLVEIMRTEKDCPLDRPDQFSGPYPSGAPAIFISAAAQLGCRTKIWGAVGRDKFGNMLLERLASDGVNLDNVAICPDRATGAAFVSYFGSGEREFIFFLNGAAAAQIAFNEAAVRETPAPDFFHVMGCSLTINADVSVQIERACRHFTAAGSRISFDPIIRPSLLRERGILEVAGSVMEQTTIFLPGVDELLLFTPGISDIDTAAASLLDRYPRLEIIHIKRGKSGSRIITRQTTLDIPIYPIERKMPIVDPTGAGDCFDAAFISAIADGKSLAQAGALAAKAGAINSAAFGPMSGDIRGLINTDIIG